MAGRRFNTRSHVSTASNDPQYFIITLTNFPTLLERTQQLSVQQGPYPSNDNPSAHEQYERYLFEELRTNLQRLLEGYLQRTRQPYPIRIVFDFSNIHLP